MITYADWTVMLLLVPCSCTISAILMASQIVSRGVRVQGDSLINLSIAESLMVVLVVAVVTVVGRLLGSCCCCCC